MPLSISSSHWPAWSRTGGARNRPAFIWHTFIIAIIVVISAVAMWYSIGATILHASQVYLYPHNNGQQQQQQRQQQQQLQQVPSFVPQSAMIFVPALNISLAARPAAFGPKITDHLGGDEDGPFGFEGPLEVVIDSYGCAGHDTPRDYTNKIVLIERGECSFYDKIYNLQTQNAAAVVVGDNVYRRGLVTMYTEREDYVVIPSVFVSKESYNILRELRGHDQHIVVTVADLESSVIGTVIFLMLSPLCSLSLIYCFLMLHRRYKKMQERASKKAVAKLPVRIWHRPDPENHRQICGENDILTNNETEFNEGSSSQEPSALETPAKISLETSNSDEEREKVWTSSAECIICMDDYVDGVSQVMRLPCHHEFHVECITRWLTTRKKTCPICKYDVTLGKRVSDSAATGGASSGSDDVSVLGETDELGSDEFDSSSGSSSSSETMRLLDDPQTRV